MSDTAAVLSAVQSRLSADSTIASYVADRIGAMPLKSESFPYIGHSFLGGQVKRYVDGFEGYSRMRIQVVVFGEANTREALYSCAARIQVLLQKLRTTNSYGTTFTMLRESPIDFFEPSEIAGKRILRIGSVWLAIAK